MKNKERLRALGLYQERSGVWRAGWVESDGQNLTGFGSYAELETLDEIAEAVEDSHDLAGLEIASGRGEAPDPQWLANWLNTPVVSDFRSNDLEFGGNGRPLSPFYLHAFARSADLSGPTLFLDIGDKATLTWVNPDNPSPEDKDALVAFEAGPALDPLHGLLRARAIDMPSGGAVVDGALELFLDDPYFRRVPPKLVGEDHFRLMLDLVLELSDAEAYTTLCGMTATAILLGLEHLPAQPRQVVLTGEGVDHPKLVPMIRAAMDVPVSTIEDFGADPCSVKAQAMAYLAIRSRVGLPTTSPNTTGVPAAIGGGRLFFPSH